MWRKKKEMTIILLYKFILLKEIENSLEKKNDSNCIII